jgi:dipeptidyl aminopeptidase/acylaminoacyl peptidase
MPWDGTFLYVADIEAGGVLGKPTLVAGSTDESIFQPEWSPDGILHFVSDRDGWWNLYAWQDGAVHPVMRYEAELGVAQWEFGYTTYAFLDDGRIAIIVQTGAHQSLEVLEHGETRLVELPYTSLKPYISASGTQVALIASSPVETPSVIMVDVDSGNVRKLAGAEPVCDPQTLILPEPFSFTARDGLTIHGLFYPASGMTGPAPLVVKAHAGPTHNAPMRLDWHTQYLTSHGFAVAEVDYRGSTGYGRAFRNALRGHWGQADACDCADAAEHLTSIGKADPHRRAIWGASAGGYTALRAITITDTFAAAIVRSPVIDPLTWKHAAPKFQAHHADALIDHSPDAYRQRSVLATAGAINRPVLLLHGEADTITPAAETRALAKTLDDRARLLVFPDEGHSFRSPKTLSAALHEELNFLSQALDVLSA